MYSLKEFFFSLKYCCPSNKFKAKISPKNVLTDRQSIFDYPTVFFV